MRLSWLLIAVIATFAQSTKPLKFEVASIKPSPVDAVASERLWGDARGRVVLRHVPLSELVLNAYEIGSDHLVGPSWLGDVYFDVVANAPLGASKADVPPMLRALLGERFGLRAHTEQMVKAVLALVVAPGGHHLVASEVKADGPVLGVRESETRYSAAGNGVNGRVSFTMDASAGITHVIYDSLSMLGLVKQLNLTRQLDREVVDATSLEGTFHVVLDNGLPAIPGQKTDGDTPGPDPVGLINASLKKQGLLLEKRRIPVTNLVIDTVSKTATAN